MILSNNMHIHSKYLVEYMLGTISYLEDINGRKIIFTKGIWKCYMLRATRLMCDSDKSMFKLDIFLFAQT